MIHRRHKWNARAQALAAAGPQAASREGSELARLVCKILYSATYMGAPTYLLQPDAFAGWFEALNTICLLEEPPVRRWFAAELVGMPVDSPA